MAKLYLDTNVLIYALEDSCNFKGKDISLSSSNLLWEAVSCKHDLVISVWTIEELGRIREISQFSTLLKIIEKKLTFQRYSEEDMQKAKERNPSHFQDELHAILALKSGAEFIVTRNVKDFQRCENKIRIAKPESLLNPKPP